MPSTGEKHCEKCDKMISSSHFARHQRVCESTVGELKRQRLEMQEKLQALEKTVEDYANEVDKAHKQIDELKSTQTVINNHYGDNNTSNQTSNTTNNVQNNTENKTQTQNNLQKNIYKCHRKDKDGAIDGLNMNKLQSFGYENWEYIDKSKAPLEILMDLYANPDHPENYIFVYNEPQKFCLLVKFPQEVRSFPLNPEALYKLGGCIVDNLKSHGVNLPEDEGKNRMIWTMFIQRFSQKYNYNNMYTNWNGRDLDDYYIKMM